MYRPLNERRTANDVEAGTLRAGGAEKHAAQPVSTEQTRVAFENSLVRVEWNVVRNTATLAESAALRIAPIDDSRHVAVIVPVLTDGRLLLLGRYRYAVARWSIEFPRYWGQSSDGGWRQYAEEQLLKDTGLKAGHMRLLGAVQADPSLIAISTIVILADQCSGPLSKPPDPDELISGSVVLDEVALDEQIRQGEIICGTTLAALCLYRAQASA